MREMSLMIAYEIVNYACTCPLVQEIISGLPPFQLEILSEDDIPLHIGGSVDLKRRLIRLRLKNNDHLLSRILVQNQKERERILASLRRTATWQMFSTFLFELLNLRNFSAEVIDEILHSSLDANEYAIRMEERESKTLYQHHEIVQLGIVDCGWPEIIDKFKNPEEILKQQEHWGHLEFYRKQYALLTGK